MPKVTYITPSGEEHVVADAQGTLMEAAVAEGVEGIGGDCGGVANCATCHVHIDPAWAERVGSAEDAETDILELEDTTTEHSRLGCQVELTPEMDGLIVRVVGY